MDLKEDSIRDFCINRRDLEIKDQSASSQALMWYKPPQPQAPNPEAPGDERTMRQSEPQRTPEPGLTEQVEKAVTAPSRAARWLLDKGGPEMAEAAVRAYQGTSEYLNQTWQSIPAEFTAQSYALAAHVTGVLEKAADKIYDNVGMGALGMDRPEFFDKLHDATVQWAQYYEGKIPYKTFLSQVVGSLLNAPLGVALFRIGKGWAFLEGIAAGDWAKGFRSVARWSLMNKAFGALGWYNPAKRIIGGAGVMVSESAVEAYTQTGKLPPAEALAKTAFVGSGLGFLGGTGPGMEARAKAFTPERFWAMRYANAADTQAYRELHKNYKEGKTDKVTLRMAQHLIAADPEMAARTSVEVVDKVRRVEDAVRSKILREQGIDPVLAKEAGDMYRILGVSETQMAEDTLTTAIKLYSGHNPSTIVEEWMHGIFERLPDADMRIVTKGYQAYLRDFPKDPSPGVLPKSKSEWFAHEAVSRFFGQKKWKDYSIGKQEGLVKKVVIAASDFYDVIKGTPGSKADKRRLDEILNDPRPAPDVKALRPEQPLDDLLAKTIAKGAQTTAGQRLRGGDEDLIKHVVEGAATHGAEVVRDAIRNQALTEVQKTPIGPERDAVRKNISNLEPKINEALNKAEAKGRHQVRKIGESTVRAQDLIELEPAEKNTDVWRGGASLKNIRTSEDAAALFKTMGALYGKQITAQRRGKISNEQLNLLADDLNMPVDKLLRLRPGEMLSPEEILAARRILAKSTEALMDMRAEARRPENLGNKQLQVEFLQMAEINVAIQSAITGLGTEMGRAVNVFNIPVAPSETELYMRSINETLAKYGGSNRVDKVIEMLDNLAKISEDGKVDVRQISAYTREMKKATKGDMLLEFWINSLLSGPKTHAANTLSNALVCLLSVPERGAAELIGRGRKAILGENADPDRVAAGETAAYIYGTLRGVMDGIKIAAQTIRTGESTDPLGKVETPRRAISTENLGISGDNWLGKGIDFLADHVVRGPGKFLLAEDDFFKAVNYRAEVHALALRTAAGEGLTGQERALRVQDLTDNPPAHIRMAATDASRMRTFTNELGPVAAPLLKMLNATYSYQKKDGSVVTLKPGNALRLIFPFVRTPVNVLKYGSKRTPLALIMPSFYADMAAGGARRDLALGQLAVGSVIGALTLVGAKSGFISGGGPRDKKARENLMATGWREYSICIGGKWHSFSRTEPFGTILGLSADAAEIWDYVEEGTQEELAAMIGMAVAKNLTSKTYLVSVSTFLDVMNNPDRYGPRWVSRMAGSFVPAFLQQVNREYFDPELREARTAIEAIKGRIPYFSKGVHPRRDRWGASIRLDASLGDGLGVGLISPIRTSEVSTPENNPMDAVDREILRNEMRVPTAKPRVHYNGVNVKLTDEEFDRYQVLAGQELGLREYLSEMVKSDRYKKATGGPDGMKAQYILDGFRRTRSEALDRMYKESYGEPGGFAERILEQQIEQSLAKSGEGYE